jgi:radical SAM superfamily enzyme YgiQ (UPF0313 family)
VTEVVEEIKQKNLKSLFFVDDNIIGNRTYAKELFRALTPLKIRWGGQAPLTIARDEDLLHLACLSGCGLLYIGIESFSDSNLPTHGKAFYQADEILQLLAKIHSKGILIRASIIFGMDDDDLSVFYKTVKLLKKAKVSYAEFFVLTPMPGTRLRERLELEKRIVEYDWSKYDGLHAVFEPAKMKKEQLEEGLWKAYREFYSIPCILRRCVKMKSHQRRFRTFLSNFYYRKMVLQKRHPLSGE